MFKSISSQHLPKDTLFPKETQHPCCVIPKSLPHPLPKETLLPAASFPDHQPPITLSYTLYTFYTANHLSTAHFDTLARSSTPCRQIAATRCFKGFRLYCLRHFYPLFTGVSTTYRHNIMQQKNPSAAAEVFLVAFNHKDYSTFFVERSITNSTLRGRARWLAGSRPAPGSSRLSHVDNIPSLACRASATITDCVQYLAYAYDLAPGAHPRPSALCRSTKGGALRARRNCRGFRLNWPMQLRASLLGLRPSGLSRPRGLCPSTSPSPRPSALCRSTKGVGNLLFRLGRIATKSEPAYIQAIANCSECPFATILIV